MDLIRGSVSMDRQNFTVKMRYSVLNNCENCSTYEYTCRIDRVGRQEEFILSESGKKFLKKLKKSRGSRAIPGLSCDGE